MKKITLALIAIIIIAMAVMIMKPFDNEAPILAITGTTEAKMDIISDIPCTTNENCKSWLDINEAPSGIKYRCEEGLCIFEDTYIPTTGGE